MKEDKIKTLMKKIKKALMFYFMLISISVLFIFCSLFYLDDFTNRKQETDTDIEKIRRETNKLADQIKSAKESSKIWQILNQNGKKRNGLEIDKLKNMIYEFGKYYHLDKNIDISMSAPEEVSGTQSKTTSIVVSSIVNITVSGPDDVLLIQFLETILNNAPGYLRVESLSLQRLNILDQSVIGDFKSGNKHNLASMKISLKWQDFKDI